MKNSKKCALPRGVVFCSPRAWRERPWPQSQSRRDSAVSFSFFFFFVFLFSVSKESSPSRSDVTRTRARTNRLALLAKRVKASPELAQFLKFATVEMDGEMYMCPEGERRAGGVFSFVFYVVFQTFSALLASKIPTRLRCCFESISIWPTRTATLCFRSLSIRFSTIFCRLEKRSFAWHFGCLT